MEISPVFAALVPLCVGLVSACKAAGLPERFAPLFSIMIGVGLAGITIGYDQSVVLYGLTIGLTASGLYSATKTSLGY